MRYAALLLTGLAALSVTLAMTVQAGQGESAPRSVTTITPEPAARTEATPTGGEVHRAVVPGLAGDWTPERCSANVPDPCLLPITQLTVTSADGESSVTLTVEVANRSDQRRRGLMFRESMDELAGMLFVFAGDRSGGFWMRNTLIPLDIAYLGADGTVLEIVHGVPLNLDILTPTQPYRYTLEVNGGWFERQGLGVGDIVAIPAGVEAR